MNSNRLWAQSRSNSQTLIDLLCQGMAESGKSVSVVPLNRSNYSTWKIQCKMALIRDGLWKIINGTETAPAADAGEDVQAKFELERTKHLLQSY